MDIPINYIIHDIRISKDFKGVTISGYKRKDVINAFQNSIINNKLEDAIRWCVELHSTGLNNIIWNSIDNTYLKYIHINNPKLFFYIIKRKKDYNSIIKRYPKKHEIFTRNNQQLRNLFAEITAILTLTKKNNMFLPKSLPSIKNSSFEKHELKKRMIAKNLDMILDYIYSTTSNDVKLALNEIIHNLLYSNGTFQNCLFWYLWLEKYQNKISKSNMIIISTNTIEEHWIFILWKLIMCIGNKLDKSNLIFLNKLENLYKENFKLNSIARKKYYIFIAFYIIKNNINWNIQLYQNNTEYLIIQTNANINGMYYNIIKSIENNLSKDAKILLQKNYNQLFYNLNNNPKPVKVKKVIDNSLDEDINKVVFTNYPEYYDLNPNKTVLTEDEVIKNSQKLLISKNKTKRDVIEQKKEEKNKQIEAFKQFIPYKNNNKPVTPKKISVVDYYKNDDTNNIKIITEVQNNESQSYQNNTKQLNIYKDD